MRTALYYPHTFPRDPEGMMRSAPLLWDHLEFIVPFRGYRRNKERGGIFTPDYPLSSEIDEAIELIGIMRVPSVEGKKAAHAKRGILGQTSTIDFYVNAKI